jgi:hypothetical protein
LTTGLLGLRTLRNFCSKILSKAACIGSGESKGAFHVKDALLLSRTLGFLPYIGVPPGDLQTQSEPWIKQSVFLSSNCFSTQVKYTPCNNKFTSYMVRGLTTTFVTNLYYKSFVVAHFQTDGRLIGHFQTDNSRSVNKRDQSYGQTRTYRK